MVNKNSGISNSFEELKKEILKADPVYFCENYLSIDGKPFRLVNSGWDFLAEIYRYVSVYAVKPDGKPVVIVKGRQVGATTMAVALEMYFTTSDMFGTTPDNPPVRILHCFPSLNNVQKFSDEKLSTMMRSSKDDYIKRHGLKYDPETGRARSDVPDDTLTRKLFRNENKLWVDSNSNLASRLQGMTVDMIFHDEIQRMLEDNVANDLRTLTAAQHGPPGQGVQLYFGTPLSKGSFFWKIWNSSDQRYYNLGCTKCNNYFLLYTPGSDEWENIWVRDNLVECPRCNHRQEKKDAIINGKWVASKKTMDNGYEPLYVGYHINQFLIPNLTKETIQAENPKYNPTKSERIWTTDILGEFYSGSALPMTEEEIYKYCKNPDRGCSTGIQHGSDKLAFMGIDWGQKADGNKEAGGKSYSTVVIGSAAGGVFQIENAFKMKKNDSEYKKSIVKEMYKRFGIKITIADIGFGNDIVPDLQREFQSRLWGCMSSGSLTNPIKVVEDNLSIICNKDLILDDIFNAMRKGKILFPLKDTRSYEQMSWLIEHCCSMEKTTRVVQGNVVHKYVKGNGPNDGLMSLMYAYMAYRFYITQGFKTKDRNVGKKTMAPVLAYAPGL